MNIIPKPGSRSYIVGKTGSGKTVLGRKLLESFLDSYIVIIDPKGSFKWPHDAVLVENLEELSANRMEKTILIRPTLGLNKFVFYNKVLEWIWRRGNTVVFVDELYLMKKEGSANTYPPALMDIITTGREKGITFIGCSQRPAQLPMVCISEAENYYCFRLRLPQDLKRMSEVAHENMKIPQNGHNFWYVSEESDKAESLRLEL
jgi:DNA helicase HerA-like ATPase